MAPKLILLLGYCFLFSVQLCFRYSAQSLDLDAYSSTSFVQAHHAHQPAGVHTEHGRVHHILNKRFEPVPELAMPAQEIGMAPVYGETLRLFAPTWEDIVPRDALVVPLRGPPARA